MKLLALLLALLTLPAFGQEQAEPDPNTLQYQNILLGMKFNYPKTWELIVGKKGEGRLLIPIQGTSDRGVVEITPVNFRSEPDRWQVMEAAFAKSKNRTVDRQWQEEILTVPLLLTRVTFQERGSAKTSETGLIYSLGFNKLMYRLTSAPEQFDQVSYEWRQVLQSLRTWDGSMPKAEDMSKIEIKDPKTLAKPDDIPHPQVPHEVNPVKTVVKTVKAPAAASLELAGAKIELHVPSDWKITKSGEGSFTLTNPGIDGAVTMTLYPTATSDPAATALFKASATSLDLFTKVSRRDENLPTPNKAGQPVAQIWRNGTGPKGSLMTCDAVGLTNDVYSLFGYRAENPARFASARKMIEDLLDRISIEPAP